MASAATGSSEFLRLLCAVVRDRGLGPADVLGPVGLEVDLLGSRGARVPIRLIRQAWQAASSQLGAPTLGLHAGAQIELGALGLLDGVLGASRNCGDALTRLVRFLPLMANAGDLSFFARGNEARLRHWARGALPEISELLMSLVLQRGRHLFGPEFKPLRVSFMHAPRGARASYEAIFGAPVAFSEPADEMVFERERLALQGRRSDPALARILEAQAERAIQGLPQVAWGEGEGDFLADVRELLRQGLETGDLSLTMLGDRLGMSGRSVQRRLKEHGLSHRQLVDELRIESAQRAMAMDVDTAEISRTLGYSSPTAFHRAFRRWKGATPGQVRSTLRPVVGAGPASPPSDDEGGAGPPPR
jgi:AraC-like DNA-binding protein